MKVKKIKKIFCMLLISFFTVYAAEGGDVEGTTSGSDEILCPPNSPVGLESPRSPRPARLERHPSHTKLLKLSKSDEFLPEDISSALFHAVSKQSVEKVKGLLVIGMSVNIFDQQKMSPLHHAVKKKNNELFQIILEKTSAETINALDSFGFTALHYAIEWGDLQVVLALLLAGADSTINAADGRSTKDLVKASKNFDRVSRLFP